MRGRSDAHNNNTTWNGFLCMCVCVCRLFSSIENELTSKPARMMTRAVPHQPTCNLARSNIPSKARLVVMQQSSEASGKKEERETDHHKERYEQGRPAGIEDGMEIEINITMPALPDGFISFPFPARCTKHRLPPAHASLSAGLQQPETVPVEHFLGKLSLSSTFNGLNVRSRAIPPTPEASQAGTLFCHHHHYTPEGMADDAASDHETAGVFSFGVVSRWNFAPRALGRGAGKLGRKHLRSITIDSPLNIFHNILDNMYSRRILTKTI